MLDGAWYKAENDRFYSDYCRGELDVIAYSEFVFSVLAREEAAKRWRPGMRVLWRRKSAR
jgi:hypothetical protein